MLKMLENTAEDIEALSLDRRQEGRDWLKAQGRYDRLLELERPHRPGEPEEPLGWA